MNKLELLISLALAAAFSASAQFTPGDLAILQVGNGTQSLALTGDNDFILDVPTAGGSPIYTDAIPTASLVNSGSSSSEGALSLSADGQSLTLAGYTGVASLPSANNLPNVSAAIANRGVAQISASGTVTVPGLTTTRLGGSATTAGNPRSAVTDGSGNYWIGGSSSSGTSAGVFLATPTTTTIYNTSGPRDLNIFNGNLYYDNSTGLMGFSGLPTTGVTPATVITFSGNASPQGFALNAAGNVAYVADSTAATGGVQKYTFNGSTWSLAYTLGAGEGIFGLAVNFANGDLYGTTTVATSANTLVEITDTGAGSTSAADTVLETAGANEVFKGVSFTPVSAPEPSSVTFIGLGLLLLGRRFRASRA